MKSITNYILESYISYDKDSKFSDNDRIIINKYQQWSRTMNASIFANNLSSEEKQLVKDLDHVLLKKGTAIKNSVVYRGISPSSMNRFKSLDGKTYVHESFLSTSIDKNKAKEFSFKGVTIEIHIKRAKAVYLQNDEFEYINEKELLFERNLQFLVQIKNDIITLIQL